MALSNLQTLGIALSRAIVTPAIGGAVATVCRRAIASHRFFATDAGGNKPAPIAFVFDVDGVLLQGNQEVLPQALKAMGRLFSDSKDMPKVPVAFLTNSGGMSERRRAHQLANLLDVPITGDQIVLSHTPFRPLAEEYSNKPVLVVGRGDVMEISKSYGFRATVTTSQLAKALPLAVPFWSEVDKYIGGPCSGRYVPSLRSGTPDNPIQAVFVFSDPTEWYTDLQLLVDTLVGGGVLGRRKSEIPSGTPPVPVFFSNPDILWSNQFSAPRFGQGAFAACVELLYEKATGERLPPNIVKFMGKPNPEPYRVIENLLTEQAVALGLLPEKALEFSSSASANPPPFSAIYSIGDTRNTDVRGANNAGRPWHSVLVQTGTKYHYDEGKEEDPADIVSEDVDTAILAALEHAKGLDANLVSLK